MTFANTAGPISAFLVTGQASGDGQDTLVGIENITGSTYPDRIEGDAGDNVFVGRLGNDLLIPGSGQDSLDGGVGSDTGCLDSWTRIGKLALCATTEGSRANTRNSQCL